MLKEYRYDGSREFKLSRVSTDETSFESDRKKAEEKMEKNFEKIQELQSKLYAEKKEGLILLFHIAPVADVDTFEADLAIFLVQRKVFLQRIGRI